MPDGFVPDFIVSDNPVEPYPLGDEREAMLSYVLTKLGGTASTAGRTVARAPARTLGAEIALERDPLDYAHIISLH